jgi:dephospho-CoA kinase
MKIYALTGGIGAGKSTVAKLFDKAGVPVISADALNAEAAKSPEIQKRIFDRFGTNDRMELRKIIFSDIQARRDIEAIMHPIVQQLFFKAFNDLADKDFWPFVIYESALVFELGQRHDFDGVISVLCPVDIRLKRVVKRDNMNGEIACNIMKCQVDEEHRETHSDFLIQGNSTMERLEEQVQAIILRIRQDCSSLPAGDKPS